VDTIVTAAAAKAAQYGVGPRQRDWEARRDVLWKAGHVAGREGYFSREAVAPHDMPDRSFGRDMQAIGCCRLNPPRDFTPGRDAAANARVGRQRKGPKAFRRQKLDLGTELASISGERLQAADDAIDLRRPRIGSDQYSHDRVPITTAIASAAGPCE